MVNPVTKPQMEALLGKGVDDFCENGFSAPSHNHCAHFVSHVLGLRYGLLCGGMVHGRRGTGATIRVDDLYNNIAQRGAWGESAPWARDGVLVFATSTGNVRHNRMANVPKKHVGILCGGDVYNFHNTQHVVGKETSVEAFRQRLAGAYGDPALGLFYAVPI